MWQIARLQSIIAAGEAPFFVNYLMVAGGLTALNKLPEVEQQALEASGVQRKIRPVNSGCAILKSPMRCLLNHPSAKRVANDLQPFQLGYTAQAGPQTKNAISRALLEAGYFVSLQDAKNAFNALHRQSMLDAIADLWPEATKVFNGIYGMDAPCFFSFVDEDGSARQSDTQRRGSTDGLCTGRVWLQHSHPRVHLPKAGRRVPRPHIPCADG
jgi:hypothetical protein